MEMKPNQPSAREDIINKEKVNNDNKYPPMKNCYDERPIIQSKVIDTVTRTEVIEREVIFDAPKNDVVLKVINIMKEIEIKDIKVNQGNIEVSGYLDNCIMYTTMKRPQKKNNNQETKNENDNRNDEEKHGYKNMGNNKSDENNKNKSKKNEKPKPSCGVVDNCIALDGVLRHTSVWIPFKSFISVEEAQEEDVCTVISSSVLNKLGKTTITPIYEEEYIEEDNTEEVTTSVMQGEEEQKFIKGIIDKTLIEITVEVKRYLKQ